MDNRLFTAAALALLAAGCAGVPKNRRVAPEGAKPMATAPADPSPRGTAQPDALEPDVAAPAGGPAEPAPPDRRPDGNPGGKPDGKAGRPDLAAAAGSTGPAPGRRDPAASGEEAEPSGTGNVSWPRTVDPGDLVTIATVGGRPIDLRELVARWMVRDPRGVRGVLSDLVQSQIVAFESAALGVTLPEGAVDGILQRRVEALSKQSMAAGAPDLDTYVQVALGLEVDTVMADMKDDAAVDLLAPRCVRAWLLSNDHREIRVIAVKDEAASREVQARLARGESFADVASELSVDASKEDGGRMPPVVRGDQPISRTAFSTSVGTVAGPIKEGEGFVFVLVEAAPTPLEGDWGAIGAAVEASIIERAVDDAEFWQWQDAMYTRYEIDITPFFKLAGR